MTNALETLNTSKNVKDSKRTHLFLNDKHLIEIPKKIDTKEAVIIYLHNNSISRIDNLNLFRNLTHLYLQWNKISRIENLECLENLKKIYLGNNHISVIEKLESLSNLTELHIEKQILNFGEKICFEPRCIAALGKSLRVLNISDNNLSHFEELASLQQLRKLIARNNDFQDYHIMSYCMKNLYHLKEVDFRGNPMCKKHRYKEKIIAVCSKLDVMDSQFVSDNTRNFLKCFDSTQKKKMTLVSEDKYALKSTSPDAQLAFLEAQRTATSQASQNRQKSMNGTVPRCFWRNKAGKKINKNNCKNNAPFDDFMRSTSEWP